MSRPDFDLNMLRATLHKMLSTATPEDGESAVSLRQRLEKLTDLAGMAKHHLRSLGGETKKDGGDER